jgi:hypothetical protein
MDEPDYEIVASTANAPYLLWQALLFHASCVETQGVAPTIVVHGDGPLLPGFRALGELGARIVTAPSYRMSDGVEYTCRNTAGSLLEVTHERPWTLICDPDFLFLEPLPKKADSLCDGRAVSWDFVSYMQVGDFNRRWLVESCRERGIDPVFVDQVRAGGVVPNLVRADVHRELATRWVSAVDTLVRVARRDGDVPWVTIAWGFALAAWEMELELALTRLTSTTHGGATAPESSLTVPILHYCYGDQSFDKRRHRGSDSAAAVWTLDARGTSVSAGFVRRLHVARDWYRERGLDVTDPGIYEHGTFAKARGTAIQATVLGEVPEPRSNRERLTASNPLDASEAPNGQRYLDVLPLEGATVGYGSLGLHGRLGYEDKLVAFGGKSFEHALSSHAPARLAFRLGGRYSRFRSRVALNDDVPAGASEASFSVFADNRLLAVAPHVAPGVSQLLEASVDGAQELELRVDTTRFEYCHAVWLDPALEAAHESGSVSRTLAEDRSSVSTRASRVRGFMTVCCCGHYSEVLSEILESLLDSRLYERSDSIDLAVLGGSEEQRVVERMVAPFDRFRIAYRSEDLQEYEYPALELLQKACSDFAGAVYYLHTKGVSHARTDPYQRYWRALMLHHVIDRHEECLAALDSHACAGTGWKGHHYSGNFWWTKAEHIRKLPDLAILRRAPRRVGWDPAADVRLQCEYWIGMAEGPFKSLGPESVHFYDDIRFTRSAAEIVNDLLDASRGKTCLDITAKSASTDSAHEAKYDVVFLDLAQRSTSGFEKTMQSALERLAPRGVLVVLGSNPPASPSGGSNDDGWKEIIRFRTKYPELSVTTVDSDRGCTVIRPYQRAKARFDPPSPAELTWKRFDEERATWLNLVSVRRFRRDLIHLPYALGGVEIRSRTDVLNALASRFGLERYLEIGVGDPADNFERMISPVRQSIDPNADATFRMTSDEFFAAKLGCETYDLVFIDGLHEADQCIRDVENSLRRLAPNGFIVLHDANPPTEWHQRPVEQFEPGSYWNGTVWKAVVRFRERHPERAVFTVDLDWGCTVIRASVGASRSLPPEPSELDWSGFEKNRGHWLNLISVEQFRGFLLD